ncbi:MAG: MoaD/ThiS family protein [Flavobacteriales bacterium]|jgi:molybdopterin converting factor small subunit|nr:MoaD/ThiS family protein [Flavobacteriales bacterium]
MEVLLFGMIAEKAGTDRLQLNAASVAELRRSMSERIPGFEQMVHVIAIDRVIVTDDRPLLGHEEVAVLPPFAGG